MKKSRGRNLISLFVFLAAVGCSTPRVPEFRAPWEGRFSGATKYTPKHQGISLLSWPVEKNARITRGYRLGARPHHGVDIAAYKGAPVLSAHMGRVIFTGRGYRGYGNLVIIDNGQGWSSFYAHLDRILVTEGQYVKRGERIATMGRTGRATGVHLHFELRKNKVPVDPMAFLP